MFICIISGEVPRKKEQVGEILDTVSHDPIKSSIQSSETNLPLKKYSAVKPRWIFNKVTAHGVLQWIIEKWILYLLGTLYNDLNWCIVLKYVV